jgi:hypothetical protein
MASVTGKVRVLILTTNPRDMENAARFLEKRNFQIIVNSKLRDGLSLISKEKPDWVLVSVNLSPAIDKFVAMLKQSFKIDPILFGDSMDRQTLTRLTHGGCEYMASKLSGPNIQMKVHQIIQDYKDKSRAKRGAFTPGDGMATAAEVKGFGHILMKGEGPKAPPVRIRAENENSKVLSAIESTRPLLPSETKLLSQMNSVSLKVGSKLTNEVARQLLTVDYLDVVILEGGDLSGYLLVGSSLESVDALAEAKRVYKELGMLTTNQGNLQSRLFGRVDIFIDDFPKWAAKRSRLISRYGLKDGEVLACFLADPLPLPLSRPHEADPQRMEVRLQDIPTNVPLPCAWDIYLPRNGKYVRMIRPSGELSPAQQDRLVKMGVSHLQYAADDVEKFGLFCVREKLFVG